MNKNYKAITIEDIINLVQSNPKMFPNGMKTKITSGDFEGNGYHRKHELMTDEDEHGNAMVHLGYEQHEW